MKVPEFNYNAYTILIIDDDPGNLAVIVDYLESVGLQVVVARDGDSGLKRAAFVKPDLILLDVVMPVMDGFETCRRLKADPDVRDIPVIFMTALEDLEDKVKAFQLGGVDYISKPFQMEEVLARIKTHLNLTNLTAQLREANETLTSRVEERTAALVRSNQAIQAEMQERMQAEASLCASEARYRALYRDNPSMFFTVDAAGVITSVNPFGAEQLGYTVAELTGMPITGIFYEEDRTAVAGRIENCLRYPGQVFTWQYRKLRKDGSLLWVEEFARAVDNPHGAPNVLIVCHDITARKRAEEDIKRRNRELALLNRVIAASVTETEFEVILEITCRELAVAFDLPQVVAATVNPERTEAAVVAEYRVEGQPAALGYIVPLADFPLAQQVLDQKMPQLVEEVKTNPHLVAIQDLVEQFPGVSLLVVPLILDGGVIGSFNLAAIAPRQFLDEEVEIAQSVASQVAGVLARLRLDEQRRQLQDQYYQSQKMEAIGQLAGGIAHDFNNILVPIIGYAELGMMRLSPDEKLYTDLEKVQGAAERAVDLTRQILAFSRKQVLEMRVLDLNTIIDNFKTIIQRLIGEDIELLIFLEPALYQVRADKGQIEQVLLNLVVNARDAMPSGGKLTIETANTYLDEAYVKRYAGTQPPGHYAMMAVSDSGLGMNTEIQQQIFEPFFTTKAPGKGTGLGLSTVFGIVRQHGGNIWVYSEPGKGATFKIYFPQVEGEVEEVETSPLEPASVFGTETVLVVEDEVMVRKLVCESLAAHGYDVIEARNPDEALHIAATGDARIHLLLTDVIMPGMNGHRLYKKLQEIAPETQVLYMSGYTDNIIVHHGILDEGVNFLQKPFSVQSLIRKVKQVLR